MENFTNKLPPLVIQAWIATPLLLNKFIFGSSMAFSSILLKEINDPNSDIKMDPDTSTWFVAMLGVTPIIGIVVTASLTAARGRRTASVVASLPAVVGFFIQVSTLGPVSLMIVRGLMAMSFGAYGNMVGLIIGEYCSPQHRGMFLNMTAFALSIGSLMTHFLSMYINWKTLAVLLPVPYLLAFVISFTSPESPAWLAQKKQYEKSRKVFYWLRGRTEKTTREIEAMIQVQSDKQVDHTAADNVKNFFKKFGKYNFWMPMFIIANAVMVTELAGRHYFASYAIQLVNQFTPGRFNNMYCTITMDALVAVGCFLSSYLIRVMNTRTLLFTSGIGTVLTLLLSSLTIFLNRQGILPESLSLAPTVFFSICLFWSNLGCTNIPYLLTAEIFLLEHKVVSNMFSFFTIAAALTSLLKILPVMVEACRIEGAFSILAVCLIVTLSALYFTLPETKNRTLQDIEDHFNRKKKRELIPNEDDEDLMKKLREKDVAEVI